MCDHYSLIQKLIAAGANVNDVRNDGSGALHCSRSRECTQILIYEGADVNLKDHNGLTPLHSAIGQSEIIDSSFSLIMAGAGVNAKCNNGETPLIAAAKLNRVQQIELLLEKGADVNIFDSSGRNALYYAAKRGNNTILQLLLRRGADVNEVNPNKKEYSLIVAVDNGHEEYMKILLQAGADVNALNSRNETALLFAAVGNRLDLVKRLFQAGAEVRIPQRAECSVLQIYVFSYFDHGLSNYDRMMLEHIRRKSKVDTEMVRLLHAAGERKEGISQKTINQVKSDHTWTKQYLPPGGVTHKHKKEYTKLTRLHLSDDRSLCLKHICRRAIREHLLQMSRVNLFIRIPHLGLPASLARYLLYDVSLESP